MTSPRDSEWMRTRTMSAERIRAMMPITRELVESLPPQHTAQIVREAGHTVLLEIERKVWTESRKVPLQDIPFTVTAPYSVTVVTALPRRWWERLLPRTWRPSPRSITTEVSGTIRVSGTVRTTVTDVVRFPDFNPDPRLGGYVHWIEPEINPLTGAWPVAAEYAYEPESGPQATVSRTEPVDTPRVEGSRGTRRDGTP